MIKGLDAFKEYFSEFNEQYVIIGGAACDIIFENMNLSFRATKDIDMVLIVEAPSFTIREGNSVRRINPSEYIPNFIQSKSMARFNSEKSRRKNNS